MLALTGLPSVSAAAMAPFRWLLPDVLVSSGALFTTDSSGTDSFRVSSVTCTAQGSLLLGKMRPQALHGTMLISDTDRKQTCLSSWCAQRCLVTAASHRTLQADTAQYLPLKQLSSLVPHEAEHVEEAVVPGGREALLQADGGHPVWRQVGHLLRPAAAQALHQQCSQPLRTPEDAGHGSRQQGWLCRKNLGGVYVVHNYARYVRLWEASCSTGLTG